MAMLGMATPWLDLILLVVTWEHIQSRMLGGRMCVMLYLVVTHSYHNSVNDSSLYRYHVR